MKKPRQRVVIEAGSPRALAIERRVAQMPPAFRRTYRLAVEGRSLRAAIKAACLECVGWQRREITLCTAPACPLWALRPYQKAVDGPSITAEGAGATADDPEALPAAPMRVLEEKAS